MTSKNLHQLRQDINAIDEALLDLLHQRWQLLTSIHQQKKEQQLPLKDPQREAQVLERLKTIGKDKNLLLSSENIEKIFKGIMEEALVHQQKL